jgi:hypothetical protein
MFMPRLNNFGGKRTALFNVNTDARDHEVPNLSWDGEIKGRNACLIPASFVKNKRDRLVVCNG